MFNFNVKVIFFPQIMESEEAGTTTIVANGTGKADENIDASDIAAGNVTEVSSKTKIIIIW